MSRAQGAAPASPATSSSTGRRRTLRRVQAGAAGQRASESRATGGDRARSRDRAVSARPAARAGVADLSGVVDKNSEQHRRECEARDWLRRGYAAPAKVDELMVRIEKHRGKASADALREEMRRQWRLQHGQSA